MLRCTLTSRGSILSLHSSERAAFTVVLMVSVLFMKLFREFRRGTTPRCPLSGCLLFAVCRIRSVRIATALLGAVAGIGRSLRRAEDPSSRLASLRTREVFYRIVRVRPNEAPRLNDSVYSRRGHCRTAHG